MNTNSGDNPETKWVGEDDFFDRMDANPSAVYLVEEYSGVDRQRTALFSTKEKAKEWMDLQEGTCVCCPFVIDEPDFGNRKDA